MEMAVFGDVFDIFADILNLFGEMFRYVLGVFLDVTKKFGNFEGRLDAFDQAADAGNRPDDCRSDNFSVIGDFVDPLQGFFQVFQDADYLNTDDGQKNCQGGNDDD